MATDTEAKIIKAERGGRAVWECTCCHRWESVEPKRIKLGGGRKSKETIPTGPTAVIHAGYCDYAAPVTDAGDARIAVEYGATFPVKDQLRAAGFSWDGTCWTIGAQHAEWAALVAEALELTLGTPRTVERGSFAASYEEIRRAAKAGTLSAVLSDQEIAEAVELGIVSVSEAMNRDF